MYQPEGKSTAPRTRQLSGIDAIKDAVPVERYAADVVPSLKQVSKTQLRGRCPIHEGENASAFVVFLDTQRWYCHRCRLGGDVLDLSEMAERHGDTWTAMLSLAQRYGVELPTKPERWRRYQDEKGAIRAAATTQVAKVYQRRLTKVFAPLVLLGGETPEEELQHLEELSAALWPESLAMARRRVNGE